MKIHQLILAASIAIAAFSFGCGSYKASDPRFELSGKEKRTELTGKIVSVDKSNQTMTIAHEDIKDYMPAMTMAFVVKDEWAFDEAKPGSEIAATLIVDGPRVWLQDVVLKETSGPSSGASSVTSTAKVGEDVPDFHLVNQDGKRISIQGYRGKALLMTFIYTRCPVPEYCTLMSNNFAEIEKQLQKEPQLVAKTHLLSVSIDPDYDTPAVLKSYGAAHTGNYSDEKFNHWEFAGGSKDEIKAIAGHFGLQYFQEKDQIIHGLRTAIIQPDGKLLKVYEGNSWKPEEVVAELKKLLAT
jgi:protein SCO1